MATATAALSLNITDNAQKSASNLNAFTAAAQKAQRVVSDFSQGLVTGAKQAWAEHQKATQSAIAPTQQFTAQIQKSNDAVTRFADTLTRRFVLGFLISQMRQLGSSILAINTQFALLADTASRVGISTGRIGALSQVASGKGIDTASLVKDMTAFAGLLDESRHYATDLSNLFAANGISIQKNADGSADFEANLLRVADLVRNASSEMDKFRILQQTGIDATRENVKLFEQGGAALRSQMDQAARPEFERLANQAEEFDRKWRLSWANFKRDGQSAFLDISGFLSRLSDAADAKLNSLTGGSVAKNLLSVRLREGATGRADFSDFGGLDKFIGSQGTAAKPTVNPQDAVKSLQQTNQAISLLGNLATVTDVVKQKQNELNIARLNGIPISAQVAKAIVEESRLQKEAADGSARLQFGLGTEADIRKQILAAIPPQVRAEAELTQAYQIQTEQLRMRNEIAQAALPGLKQLELSSKDVRTQLDTLGQGLVNGITNPLVDLASGATKAGDAFKQMGLNIIRSIEQMIVNMTIAAPIARGLLSIFAPFVPGGGIGWAGQPTALGSASFATAANGNVFSGPGISAFSNSIVERPTIFPFAKGIGLMGEAGAEAIMPLTRIGGKLGVLAEGGNSSNISVNIGTIALPQDPNGNDPSGSIRAQAVSKAIEGTVRNIVKDEMVRGQRPGGMLNRSAAV